MFRGGQVASKHSITVAQVLAIGVILVLIGFVMVAPRGGVVGSTNRRSVIIGRLRETTAPGYEGHQSTRYRVIRITVSLLLILIGVVVIAASG